MKPADIVVGKKYRHKNYLGVVYLGVGERDKDNYKIFKRKKLIIFVNPSGNDIGAIVTSPKECSYGEFWDGFYPEN